MYSLSRVVVSSQRGFFPLIPTLQHGECRRRRSCAKSNCPSCPFPTSSTASSRSTRARSATNLRWSKKFLAHEFPGPTRRRLFPLVPQPARHRPSSPELPRPARNRTWRYRGGLLRPLHPQLRRLTRCRVDRRHGHGIIREQWVGGRPSNTQCGENPRRTSVMRRQKTISAFRLWMTSSWRRSSDRERQT